MWWSYIRFILKVFHFFENFGGLFDNLGLRDTPKFDELVDDLGLLIEHVNSDSSCHVIKSEYTVLDACGFKDFDPADFASIVTVRSAACLDVSVCDVDNSQVVTWDDTTLVEAEAIGFFGISLIHKALRYGFGA